MSEKILVTTRSFRRIQGQHQQILLDAGYEIVTSLHDRPLSAEELGELIPGVDAAILGVDDVSEQVISRADRLQVISRFGVGVDRVDLEAATAKGIVVTNTPGANSIAVAELTIALMLALARHIPQHSLAVQSGTFSPITGAELLGSTLGIIGMGQIGKEVAFRAASFGMPILYHDIAAVLDGTRPQFPASYRSLDELLRHSDFVSLHLPLVDSTRQIINKQALQKMKPSAFLINTARGGLVDEKALYEALQDNVIAGAASDVFAEEPPIGNPLLGLPNFIATPHVASATKQTTLRMGLMASQNALIVLRGDRPAHVVNPAVYD